MMRNGEPMTEIAPPRQLRAIVRTPLLPATIRTDAPTITAIAARTFDERSKTQGMRSVGTTRGVHMGFRTRPIPVLPLTDMTIGGVSQGATGRVLHRVSKATTTRAVPSHETTGRRMRMHRHHVDEPRASTTIAHPWALIAVADPLPCR